MSSTRYIVLALLKILLVIALIIILFVVGTMIGYSVIGDGKATDVFNKEVWTHILDFLN